MNNEHSRRQFFTNATAATLAAGISLSQTVSTVASATAMKNEENEQPLDEQPLFKISLAQWSLHRAIGAGRLTNLDFPGYAKQEFGIDAVEYVNGFFRDKAEDADYLTELNRRCDDHGVTSVLIMVDGEGSLGNPDAAERQKTVENHFRWVTAAKTLGCHSIRVNAESEGSFGEQARLAADGLAKLSEFAAEHGIGVIVENHGGLSSNGQWLAQVIRRVNMDNCGTLPDFGNFIISGKNTPDEVAYDRYIGMAALLPFAKAVSAKSYDFDEQGNETKIDYPKVMQMVVDSGYRGFVGVEYEGSRLPENDGIIATRDLLLRCRDELAG